MKSYTPWKMWGSWIGLASYLLLLFFLMSSCSGYGCYGLVVFFPTALIFRSVFGAILSIAISGFLIGWGVNSLWRKFRK